MTNYAAGHAAEKTAADFLKRQGYKIVDLNWRTPRCEIDIVASKDRAVYFIEVKYRQSGTQGSGLDYITAPKLRRMRFAAEIWVQNNKWSGDFRLGAIEVSGPASEVSDFLPDLDT